MPSAITFDHVQQARMGWTTRLVESFLEQLSCHQVFMDVDIIPEAWTSSRMRKKTTTGVLASLRGSTYGPEYDSPLRSLRPCWTAFCASCMNIQRPFTAQYP
jgi:hypothetical protein